CAVPPPRVSTDICTLSLHAALPISLLSTLFRPAAAAYAARRPAAKAHLLGLGHLLRQTGLFAARGILVQNALGGGFIDSGGGERSEEHTSELQSRFDLVCRRLLDKK